jgi:hypothetical protein
MGRYHEGLAIVAIETNGDVARQLEMLLLIFAHRHQVRLIKQDVRGHQHGIVEQADQNVFFLLAGFVLELRHPFEFRQARHAVKQPGKFGMGRHI